MKNIIERLGYIKEKKKEIFSGYQKKKLSFEIEPFT